MRYGAPPNNGSQAAKPRILLVEDDERMRIMLKRLLGERYEVVLVENGEAGLATARECLPDLVLSDVVMPGLDGVELVRELRAGRETRTIPVILLTGRDDEDAVVAGMEAGADDFLAKPFRNRELLARIATHLELSRMRRETERLEAQVREQAIALELTRVREEAAHVERDLRSHVEVAEARVVAVLESVTDGFIALDAEWRFTYVNAQTERIYWRPRREVLGKVFWEVFPECHDDVFHQALRRAASERVTVEVESFCKATKRWFESKIYPSNDGGISLYMRDVTPRKETEARLDEARQLFNRFMEHSPMVAYITDEEGRMVFVNKRAEQTFKRPLQEWIGKTAADFLTAEEAEGFAARDRAVLTTGTPSQTIETLRHEVGERVWLTTRFPITDTHGKRLVAAMALDITEHKRMEDRLRETETKLMGLFRSDTIGIVFAEHETIIEANDAFLSMVGYTRDDLLAGAINWRAMTPPEWSRRMEIAAEELLRTGRMAPFEKEYFCKDGTRISVLVGGSLLSRNPSRQACFVLDISERKLAEELLGRTEEDYRNLLDAIPQFAVKVSAEGGILYINQSWVNYTGLTRAETVAGQWRDVVHPEDVTRMRTSWEAAHESGRMWECEHRLRRSDGVYRWHLTQGVPIPGSAAMGGRADWFLTGVDIEAQKQTEHALKASEEHLRLMVESAREYVIFTMDMEGKITSWNAGAERIFGYSAAEILARKQSVLFTPEDREWDEPQIEQEIALAQGRAEDERWHVRKDGTRLWTTGVAMPLRDAEGEIHGFVKILRDQTENKRAEEQLRRTEQRFRSLVQNVRDYGILMLDAEGRVTDWNEGATRITGYTPEEAVGHFVSHFCPEERPIAGETERELLLSVIEGHHETETWRLRKDGSRFWANEVLTALRDEQGGLVGFTKLVRDLTDRKHTEDALKDSEERLRMALEAAGMGFWDWRFGEGYIRWEPAHNRLIGISPEVREGSIERFLQLVHPEDRDRVMQSIEKSRCGRTSYDMEFRIQRDDGVVRWLSGHGRCYYDADGRAVRMIGVVRDITPRKDAEETLRRNQAEIEAALVAAEKAREQAEAAGRAKDQFLAVLSHELRTPLTPVTMAVHVLLKRKDLPPALQAPLLMIRRNIELEAHLIGDLLDLTKIASNKMDLHFESADLHQAVVRALEICESDLREKNQTVTLHWNAPNAVVWGDFARLQQVFWNLVKNASKFTPQGGKIEISSEIEGDRVRVHVADTGIGIAPEAQAKIFDPFAQADESIVRQFGGLGLGLSLSRGIARAHHGELRVASEGVGKGAVFTVELTLDKAVPAPALLAEVSKSGAERTK